MVIVIDGNVGILILKLSSKTLLVGDLPGGFVDIMRRYEVA